VQLAIKRDLKFHDGSPLTAEDVKFTLDRARGSDNSVPAASSSGSLSKISNIAVVDPLTVKIDLSAPFPTLNNSLAYFPGLVVPKNYIAKVGIAGFLTHPVGSGPYMFVSSEQGQEIKLAAFSGFQGTPAPVYRDVTLRVLTDPSARLTALRSGQIQLAVDVDVTQIGALKAAGFVVDMNPAGQILNILFNHKTPGLSDPRVGQAFNLAVDREAIADTLLKGAAKTTPGLDPATPMNGITTYSYDPKRAAQLLHEASFDFGRTLVLDYPAGNYPDGDQIVQTVQSDLSAVGVKVQLRAMDPDDWLEKSSQHQLDDMTLTRLANTTYDSYQTFADNLTCDGSFSLWCSAPLDGMISVVNGNSGTARKDGFMDIDRFLHDNPPGIFLVQVSQVYAMAKGVQWSPTPGVRNYTYAQVFPVK
jgi:peptide/nickel transport system substrate-binding protein